MSCFPCFSNDDEEDEEEEEEEKKSDIPIAQPKPFTPPSAPPPVNNSNHDPLHDARNAADFEDTTVKSFTFREIATATKNFRHEFLLGEGGFGKVFKGTIQSTGKTVAIRQLERNLQGNNFVFEISTLSLIRHPSLVKMVGYCADGEQRFLVYEYLESGSLKSHLFDLPAGQKPLDWTQRMKVALGVAEGLEYLHEKADPTVIYRDLRSSNILLTETKSPKLADYCLAKILQGGNKTHMSVMSGFNGYCAPEFEKNGELTVKADVYSFGVVLLELITGRKALDTSLPPDEQSLVSWAQPLFKDPSKFPEMADPLLRKGFAVTSLNQAVGVAAMCLMEEPIARPFISDISAALSFLAMAPPQAPVPDLTPILSRKSTSQHGGGGGGDKVGRKDDDSSSDEEEEAEDNNRDREYNSEEYIDSSGEEEEDEEARCRSKKSMKMQSGNDSRSDVKKPAKAPTPTAEEDSSSSSDDEPPPPVRTQPPNDRDDDRDDGSSSSDDEILDGEGGSSPAKDREALDFGHRSPSESSSVVFSDDDEED